MQRKQKIKYGIGFFISVILFVLFVGLGGKVKGIDIGVYLDEGIMTNVKEMITPRMKGTMIFISFLGSIKFYIPLYIILISYFIKKKNYINSLALFNGVLLSALINFLVKGYYVRIRPIKYFQIDEIGFSFPSGHSMVAISSYFILTYVLFKDKPWKGKKIFAWICTTLLVLSIGFSRIYLGVHWPTDVIGGLSLGFIWVYLNIIMIEILNKRLKQSKS